MLALPFHLMITCTGLVTLVFTFMPWAVSANFKSLDAYFEAAYPARAEIIDIGHALRPDSYLDAQDVAPGRVIAFNTFAGILQTVSLGGHSAIMPADISRGAGVSDLRFIPLDPAPPERVVCLLSPASGLRSPASLEMAQRIRTRFAN